MTAILWIGFWAAAFLATHLVISSSAVRPRLIAAVGEQSYRGIYSMISIATLGPLIYEFAHHKHVRPLLWFLRDFEPARWLAWLLMAVALILFAASGMNPSPAAISARAAGLKPRGVLKITRHPAFTAFSLFGIAHLLMNGWAGDAIFFGTFPALAILGGLHQDRRKLRELGDPYRRFVEQTSFMPLAALLAGRQRWTAADMPWAAIGAGIALTIAIVALHPILFGGHPLG